MLPWFAGHVIDVKYVCHALQTPLLWVLMSAKPALCGSPAATSCIWRKRSKSKLKYYGVVGVSIHVNLVVLADAPEMAELGLIEPLGNILSQLSQGGGAKGINIDAVSPLSEYWVTMSHLYCKTDCVDSQLSCALHTSSQSHAELMRGCAGAHHF